MDYLMRKPPLELVKTNENIDMKKINFVGRYGLNPNLLIIDESINRVLMFDKLNYRITRNGIPYYRGMRVKISVDAGLFVGLY